MSWPKGKKQSEAMKAKIVAAIRKSTGGWTSGFSGHTHSEEAREKIRRAHIGKPKSNEHKAKISATHAGKPKTYPVWNTGRPMPTEERQRISNALKGRHLTPDQQKKQIEATRIAARAPERRKKLSTSHRTRWAADPVYAKKRRLELLRGCNQRPTRPETRIGKLLRRYFPKHWKYVGDGKFIVGGKNPDFVNVNGLKAVIEVFGRYWHKPADVKTRTRHFKQYGFRTLCVWEDVQEKDFVAKVKAFEQAALVREP